MSKQRPLILLVEDDASLRRSTQLLLQGRGFDVRAYAAGDMMLRDDQIENAACLLVDYRLDGWNGISLLAALRKAGWQGPAVLATAYSTPQLRRLAKDAGFAAFLEKPIPDTLLIGTITQLTRQLPDPPVIGSLGILNF